MLASVLHFYSGKPLQIHSGVDTLDLAFDHRPCQIEWRTGLRFAGHDCTAALQPASRSASSYADCNTIPAWSPISDE